MCADHRHRRQEIRTSSAVFSPAETKGAGGLVVLVGGGMYETQEIN